MFIEIITLQTPRGRLMFFLFASVLIYVAPYEVLSRLSLWQAIGIDSPSIGLTRAYWYLLHGDFSAALERNKLILAVLAVGVPMLLLDMYKLIRNALLHK
jgi:hypothetical protein